MDTLPFSCSGCHKGFSTRVKLRSHVRANVGRGGCMAEQRGRTASSRTNTPPRSQPSPPASSRGLRIRRRQSEATNGGERPGPRPDELVQVPPIYRKGPAEVDPASDDNDPDQVLTFATNLVYHPVTHTPSSSSLLYRPSR